MNYENIVGTSLEEPIDESHPVLQFQYKYSFPFATVAAAFVQKYNYESKTNLTTASNVQQVDEDTVVFYRRNESVFSDQFNYERVTIDRKNGGQITSEFIRPRPYGERLFERGLIAATEAGAVHNHFVFDHQGVKSWKVNLFKTGVENVIKAIKFAQLERE